MEEEKKKHCGRKERCVREVVEKEEEIQAVFVVIVQIADVNSPV